MVPNDCHTLTRKKTAGRKTLGRRAVWVSGTKPLTQNPAVGRAVWVSGTKPFTQNPAVVRAVWVSGTKPFTQNPAVVRAVWVSGTKPFTQNPAVVRADIVLLWLHGPGHELDASLKGKAT